MDHFERITAEELARQRPGKWSVAEILEHLALTFDGTRRNLQKCLDTGARRATRATFRQRWGVLMVVELGRFPTGVQAPPFTRPKGLPPEAALTAVRENYAAMERVMAACAARFGTRRPLADHPILGPLSLRQWRRFHQVHVRHHLRQIKAAR